MNAQPPAKPARTAGALTRTLDWAFEIFVVLAVAGALLGVGLMLSRREEAPGASERGVESRVKLRGWAMGFDDRTALSTMLDTGALNSPFPESGYCLLKIRAGRIPHVPNQVAVLRPGLLYSVGAGDTVRTRPLK